MKGENLMKSSRLLVIVSCLCLLGYIYNGVVFGLSSDDASVTVNFSDETPSQGSAVIVTVTLTNLGSNKLEVYYFGLNFDWMEKDQFAGHDLSDNPAIVSAGGTYTFSPVTLQIPSNASVGAHSYFVGMDGYEGETEIFSWDSPTKVIVIQDSWKKIYNDLVDQTANNITIAENTQYKSPVAQSYLEQAQKAYSTALDYASQESYENAISSLQSASIYLEQAETEEETYVEPEPQQDLSLIIIGLSVAAVLIIVVVLILLRRKPKT